MNLRRTLAWTGLAVLSGAAAWLLFVALPAWDRARRAAPPPAQGPVSTPVSAEARPKIRARVYYVAASGRHLEPVVREVEYAADLARQARHLAEALLTPPDAPLRAPLPQGTALRGVFVNDRREVFVDVTGELARGHGGGTLDEQLTVFALVNTIADNLPAVTGVQILVDGQEVETLAGHVDLRRPLRRRDLRPPQADSPSAGPRPE